MDEDDWMWLGNTRGWGQFFDVHLIREDMLASTVLNVLSSNIHVRSLGWNLTAPAS
jgi:hypothetical protein